ncbi:MAG: hypothetical protein JWQ96_3247 [Segetibacter sp.]|nr:hypothetical protein [Segetibacter sp.]
MVLNTHLCMGKKVTKNCLCKKASEDKKSDCCKDKVKVVKVDNAHKASADIAGIQPLVANLPVKISLIDVSKLPAELTNFPVAHGPPLVIGNPLYVQYSVFRI